MNTTQVHTFLNSKQIDTLINYVSKHINSVYNLEIEDIDECFDEMSIRLCIEFNVGLDGIDLNKVEVLDEYWNTIYMDSSVLRQRLEKVITDYNYNINKIEYA